MKPQVKKQVLVFMLAPSLPAVTGGDIYAVNAVLPFAEEIDYHLFCYVGGDADRRKVEQHRALYDKVFRSVHLEPRPKMPFELPKVQRALSMARQALQGLPFIDASWCIGGSCVCTSYRPGTGHRCDRGQLDPSGVLPSVPARGAGHPVEPQHRS